MKFRDILLEVERLKIVRTSLNFAKIQNKFTSWTFQLNKIFGNCIFYEISLSMMGNLREGLKPFWPLTNYCNGLSFVWNLKLMVTFLEQGTFYWIELLHKCNYICIIHFTIFSFQTENDYHIEMVKMIYYFFSLK